MVAIEYELEVAEIKKDYKRNKQALSPVAERQNEKLKELGNILGKRAKESELVNASKKMKADPVIILEPAINLEPPCWRN